VTNIAETDSHFLNVICNAFDQYENCIDETVIPGDAGLIELTFTKTPVSATLNSQHRKDHRQRHNSNLNRCRRSVFGGSLRQRHRGAGHPRNQPEGHVGSL